MRFTLQLRLTLAAVLALMTLASLLGLYGLNQALTSYQERVVPSLQREAQVAQLAVSFKVQVQEWKNTLLRGKAAPALDKHWQGFTEQEAKVQSQAQALASGLPAGELRAALELFVSEHRKMGEQYRLGLDAFKAADFDPTAGDAAVKGMDRAPTQRIDELGHALATQAQASAGQAGDAAALATRWSVGALLGAVLIGVLATLWLKGSVQRQLGGELEQAVELVHEVAAGQLQGCASGRGGLMGELEVMRERLHEVVATVRGSAERLTTASTQMAQGNGDLNARNLSQFEILEQIGASVRSLGQHSQRNQDGALQASSLARRAADVAQAGGEVVSQVVGSMRGMNDASRQIADIIGVIDGIAFQTNILALNAAVEAARAGEQGRGFAVVASEVRMLAQRSAEAAKQIKTLINASVERVEQGTLQADRAGTHMAELVDAIHQVAEHVGRIAQASREQDQGVSQLGSSMTRLDGAARSNSALVQQGSDAAQELAQQAQALMTAVSSFQLSLG